jgi:hypothetical protein
MIMVMRLLMLMPGVLTMMLVPARSVRSLPIVLTMSTVSIVLMLHDRAPCACSLSNLD